MKFKKEKQVILLCILSIIFYGSLLFLTLNAWDIRCARLPQVTASRLKKEEFRYVEILQSGQEYETTRKFLAIPKEVVEYGQFFAIDTVHKDDLTYYFAREVSIAIDMERENENSYALVERDYRETIILTGYEGLEDGCEVHIVKEEKEKK